ncbi:MAG: isochorismatase family protein [Pyrinomonadaceae bacterium]|nr:isochorismatase family protein [Pyrinomonadaceae bacterium]
MHRNTLEAHSTALVVVDIQEAFRDPIPDSLSVIERAVIAVRGFQMLGVPVIVTEQYPRGLGRTVEEILLSLADEVSVIEKSSFSACGSSAFVERLRADGVETVVLCGVEAHVCVSQTAHDLLADGIAVHLLLDAVSSRNETDKRAGLKKMFGSGVVSSSVEMALFELLRDSRHPHFKEVQALIK